jgi:hypothetical protein
VISISTKWLWRFFIVYCLMNQNQCLLKRMLNTFINLKLIFQLMYICYYDFFLRRTNKYILCYLFQSSFSINNRMEECGGTERFVSSLKKQNWEEKIDRQFYTYILSYPIKNTFKTKQRVLLSHFNTFPSGWKKHYLTLWLLSI